MKFDFYLMRALATAATLLGVYCLGWAVVLLLMQAGGWLKFGDWQPVPLYTLLLSESAQSELRYFGSGFQPLNAVPAWGWGTDLDALVLRVAGQMAGVQRIVYWLLHAGLTVWLVVTAFALFYGAGVATEEAEASSVSRRSKAQE